jgi:formylglycine-generating enzyme required for sulfatase activity
MHGNVCEWCQDRYDAEYYKRSPVDDPVCWNAASLRVFRGGTFLGLRYCRSASRHADAPDNRFDGLGFRVARGRSGR